MEELLASPHMMETAAIVLAATAATAWINAKVLKLPVAVGMLVLGLIFSLIAYTVDYLHPELGEAKLITTFLKDINYPTLVLEFLLAYLLFAGALNVNLGALGRRSVAVLVLAVAGTIITAVLMAAGFWGVAQLIGIDLPPAWALVFGVLISPTDPIAVLAMTKRTSLEPHLQAQIEGEALFNDGVAVVLFGAALAYAMATTGAPADVGAEASGQAVSVTGLTLGVLKQALGGAALGLGIGVLGVLVNRTVDDWATETLVTVAVATGAYFAAMHLGLSGPIGVVVAGLVGASNWADRGHSEKTKHYLHPFWHVIDEALNAVLFLLAGFIFFQ
ncbi:MAG: cation:proton antiporter, partial [Caulobacteraceae bacterium]